jgi:Tfp pilus assembly protein PilN
MRPVNLIPQDARRGDRGAMRTGAFSYVLIAGLGLALLAVIAFALTSKQISDRKSEVAQLQQVEQQTRAKAQSLQAFADFRAMQESRSATVTSLAQSRFDWQRVLNELARVIPSNVWLVQLAGTASPDVSPDNDPAIEMRSSIQGPALEIVGCTTSQDAVAGLISNLQEIDGVTRVGMQSSELPGGSDSSGSSAAPSTSGPATTSGAAGGSTQDCQTRDFIVKFQIVVAFDSVPTPATASSAPSVPSSLTASASQSTATPPAGG